MTRKEFIEKSFIASLAFPFLSTSFLQACAKSDFGVPNFQTDYSGTVYIIGAGAAGLTAAYLLKQYNVPFKVFEAAPQIGGRIRKTDSFADFPIDLGAEWIHTDPEIFNRILAVQELNNAPETIEYNPQTIKTWNNNKLKKHNYIKRLYSEWKFKSTTWFDFFETFILPEVQEHVVLNCAIQKVEYNGNEVQIISENGDSYYADKVLVTASVRVLQNQGIAFIPALPQSKIDAINNTVMGHGIKIFVEFKERFYPDILSFGNIFKALNTEDKFVYDAAFKKESSQHILGLFAINQKAEAYTTLDSEEAIIALFLSELDEMFNGQASEHYTNHIIQNWFSEPYVQGAYSYSFNGKQNQIVEQLKEPVNNQVYFAGEALSIENQAMVHGACESAYVAVSQMLNTTLSF